ncbi:hypothetical protein [Ancylobacter rudongensis]|jgi:hypothetical protein|uniref:Uncharacterized protein n=1 Tax=Ancylobacter rudongensis TaxID=177413 RepID=A0A1G4UFS7_9HYPH|nr:hypothetical protein [Ancylobacter rudongensis]SCW91785.1 hypothetical protein SAMN05660859_3740 [Ancylobacter rudongensis]
MAKEQRSNREAKKPKKVKAPEAVAPSLAKGLSTPITLPKKKKG